MLRIFSSLVSLMDEQTTYFGLLQIQMRLYIYIYDFYGYIEHSWHPAHQISALLILVMVSIMSFKTAPEDPEFSGLWNGMSQLSSAHKLHLRLLLQDKIWPRTRLG